ncbi:Transposase [mine drainage metagenome]|uniref:Transposase n=1 Tax=mine drainage metagenome TaxID=410659 RepID=T1BL28_9ZZZZ
MQAIGVIPRYGGVLIHDGWASYLAYEHCGHGRCGAHLLRELAFLVEVDGYPWAKNMKRLLQHTPARRSRGANAKRSVPASTTTSKNGTATS